MESETAHIWRKLNYVKFNVFLFADDDVKTNNSELCFCKVFQDKCFIKKLYFGSCNLFTRKDLLERCLLEKIKSLV